ncbi:MAG TPA: calcium-binding protein [Allosphingosinicella sp.]
MAIINGTAGDDNLVGTPGDDQINGFAGDDALIGQGGNDVLDAGDDHDSLRGGDGDDILLGGNGDDFLRGDDTGVGDDILDGGAGWDRATYAVGASAGVTVDLNIQGVAQNTGSKGLDTLIGIEHLSGTAFDDVLTGDAGDNWLWGGSNAMGLTGNDIIVAGDGNDLVEVGTGNHDLDGGIGIDSLSLWGNDTDITATGVTVSLLLQGGSQDTEQGMMILNGFENLSGSKYADSLTGDGGSNILAGDQGNDFLAGGGGSDILYGDGRLIVDTHDTGGSGPITFYADVNALDPISFASGDDTLDGGDGNDTLHGGGGSDTASYASASGEVVVSLISNSSSGAAGNDVLVSIENVTGSAFDDFIRGSAGNNVLDGGAGHDFMRGGDGSDTLLGGTGDDYMDGGVGNDVFDGGAGWDRVSFAVNAASGVTVDLNIAGVAQATGHGNDTLSGIEHLSGTKFDDVLTGDNGDNWLWGGSDSSGVTGNDTITANGGNDLVTVGTGNHLLSGGSGVDTLGTTNEADITAAGLTLSLALQGAAQASEQGSWNLSGFENLSGSLHDDNLSGDAGANLLAGSIGNDTLSGGDGDDILYGDGNVTVDTHGTGGSGPIVTYVDYQLIDPVSFVSGNDTLIGGKGDDLLVGGGGNDTLTGGQGKDLFLFGNGTGDDVITDMAKQDTIAIAGVPGVDDFGDLTIVTVGGNAVVSWGTTDSITLVGMKAKQVSASMFVFEDPTAPAAAAFAAASSDMGSGNMIYSGDPGFGS